MLYPTPEKWAEWGILDECHQFFALHWTELFDTQTPDTWQVRTCNLKTILQELVEAAQIAKRDEGYRIVLRSLLDEAFAVVKRDEIVANHYPFVVAYLRAVEETYHRREGRRGGGATCQGHTRQFGWLLGKGR